ncbi:MAG: hypothetical protein HYT62_00015 [Candidatus Yanofskybacteria bacterium]|nr:hypothetical protein [Candidatus Yanofskybacteria bacterium]
MRKLTAVMGVLLISLLISDPVNAQDKPHHLSIFLYSVEHEIVVDSNGKFIPEDSIGDKLYIAQIAANSGSLQDNVLNNNSICGEDMAIYYSVQENGAISDLFTNNIQGEDIKGCINLRLSNWRTVYVFETNREGEMFGVFYKKVGRNYEVLYPRKRIY